MLTAVWVAVVAFVVGAGVAVYVMLKAARLMSQTSAAVAGLRERGDLLIERANAAIDQAGEQIARTETVTASPPSSASGALSPGARSSNWPRRARVVARSRYRVARSTRWPRFHRGSTRR